MSRRALLLMVAAIIAAFTAISVRSRLSQSPPPVVQTSMRIVIAKHDLAPGTFVQGMQDLDWGVPPASSAKPVKTPATPAPEAASEGGAPEPAPLVDDSNYLREGAVKLTDFNGAVVRRPLRAGEPVPQSALMKSGEGGFLSAVLNPSTRAVSIAVNATSGNAGFISPGDHIDLIVTHHVKTVTTNNPSEESVVSETFIHDVRVVAVDQMLDNPENKAILAKTVTVEVTPHQAEQVAVAAEMGKISVALRSVAGQEIKTPDAKNAPDPNDPDHAISDLYGTPTPRDSSYTRDSDLSELLEHKGLIVPRVQVLRGEKTESIDFYQGGQ